MKIALLTYFSADNYGATLQAYATIKALEALGNQVTLVNYTIPDPPNSIIKKIVLYPKHLKFSRFRSKYFKSITRPYHNLKDLQNNLPQADCFMVGSDQTWNPFISKETSSAFFLDLGCKDIYRASYAASFGMEKWEDSEWLSYEKAKSLLHQFDAIAVRENSGVLLLKEEFGIENAVQVLDPVLLFRRYDELVSSIKSNREIVLYKLVNSSKFYQLALNLGHDMRLPIRSIGSIRKIKGVMSDYPESIEKWIWRIACAEYVLTDSFHGTVISLLYGKQFVVCVGDVKRITRIFSLLSLFDLESRIMFETDGEEAIKKTLNTPIDYATVYKKLEELRETSLDYLRKVCSQYLNDKKHP